MSPTVIAFDALVYAAEAALGVLLEDVPEEMRGSEEHVRELIGVERAVAVSQLRAALLQARGRA